MLFAGVAVVGLSRVGASRLPLSLLALAFLPWLPLPSAGSLPVVVRAGPDRRLDGRDGRRCSRRVPWHPGRGSCSRRPAAAALALLAMAIYLRRRMGRGARRDPAATSRTT